MNYYNPNIQLSNNSINQILLTLNLTTKFLVFGLGYDSEIWYNVANTYFIEDTLEYINLNKNIDLSHIMYHKYENINVKNSFNIYDIEKYPIPKKLLELSPFDVILIDGPAGYNDNLPGRLLPSYWAANKLSRHGTIIFMDDVDRKLEKYCIERFFSTNQKTYFEERGFIKIII